MAIYTLNFKNEFGDLSSDVSFHMWKQNKTTLHNHDYYEIFLVTEGEILHSLNGKTSKITQKTLYFIYPSDTHQFAPSNNCESSHLNFAFTSFFLSSLCSFIGADLFELIINREFPNHMVLDDMTYDYILMLFSKINTHRNKELINMIAKQIVITLMISLYRAPMHNKTYPKWFSNLLNKIRSEEFMDKSVSDIYVLSNYTQPMLSYYFKKYTGETISSYFIKLKLNYSCNLLLNTNFSIIYISNAIGYASLSHFMKIFKEYTGMTPNEFRKIKEVKKDYKALK